MTMECVEKLIRKDMLDPINGKHMKEKDIIQLERVRKYGSPGDKIFKYCTCPAGRVTYNFH